MSIRYIRQSDMLKCPFAIMDPSHYRNDGTCKCDDPEHRAMMIADWGYTLDDFKDIPLRLYIPAPALSVLDQAIQDVIDKDNEYDGRDASADYQYVRAAIDNLRLVWAQVGGNDAGS